MQAISVTVTELTAFIFPHSTPSCRCVVETRQWIGVFEVNYLFRWGKLLRPLDSWCMLCLTFILINASLRSTFLPPESAGLGYVTSSRKQLYNNEIPHARSWGTSFGIERKLVLTEIMIFPNLFDKILVSVWRTFDPIRWWQPRSS